MKLSSTRSLLSRMNRVSNPWSSARFFTTKPTSVHVSNPPIAFLPPKSKILWHMGLQPYLEDPMAYNANLTQIITPIVEDSEEQKRETGTGFDLTVALTGDLQQLAGWSAETAADCEAAFLKAHADHLPFPIFRYHALIDAQIGRTAYEQRLAEVIEHSQPQSTWYTLMQQVVEKRLASIPSPAAREQAWHHSLAYQRAEYAFIASLAEGGYTHIAYYGLQSAAWAYIDTLFPKEAPTFIQLSPRIPPSPHQNHLAHLTPEQSAKLYVYSNVLRPDYSPKTQQKKVNSGIAAAKQQEEEAAKQQAEAARQEAEAARQQAEAARQQAIARQKVAMLVTLQKKMQQGSDTSMRITP